MATKLTPNLLKFVEQRYRDGQNAEQINEFLEVNYGFKMNVAHLRRRIAKIKNNDLQCKQDAIRLKASEEVENYLHIMHKDIMELDKASDELFKLGWRENLSKLRTIMELKIKYIAKQCDITGLKGDGTNGIEIDEEQVVEELIQRLGI
jgi:hypothetical protein